MSLPNSLIQAGFVVAGVVMCSTNALAAEKPQQAAREIDRLLADELGSDSTRKPVSAASDEQFLRRVSLDIIGKLPTANQLTLFTLSSSPDKRQRLVRKLLADKSFGDNWSRYWWDVIMFRASEARAAIFGRSAQPYLADQFNTGASWSDIATALVTANGDVSENGNTLLIFAQEGKNEEVAAEVSRIFMGIQIQCAQCHDHPYDRWKREQFHELAAFFARVGMKRSLSEKNRQIYLQEMRNNNSGNTGGFSGRRPKTLFGWAVYSFDGPDTRGPRGETPPDRNAEHYMSDLKNPEARGTRMTPKLFSNGKKSKLGLSDVNRRAQLADWLTAESNPFFATAFVNRMWSEMVGEGFYEPVDDLGPDRSTTTPKTVKYLATEFAGNKYDIKWLFETITMTAAYQSQGRPRRDFEDTPFQANCPQPLRANQLHKSLVAALDLSPQSAGVVRPSEARGGGGFGASGLGQRGGSGRGMMGMGAARASRRGLSGEISDVFGYDPSTLRDEVTASIPQSLLLMNSPEINKAISSGATSRIGRMITEFDDDEDLTIEIYLRCYARSPKDSEIKTCLEYVKEVRNRREAFEDIVWALINSAEFRHRR
jgi:hypothetical protein